MAMQQNSSAHLSGAAASTGAAALTVDPAEIAKFSKLSDEWWDPNGKMAPLHKINPLRLTYIRDAACRKFERNVKSLNCLSGLRILDIGCGAGLLCEPFTRLGAQVIGVDPSATNIAAAKLHADKGHLSIDYRCTTISITTLKAFDIVRTATGGNFDTSVLAYEFYVQSFRSNNAGLGAALATMIFVLVMPIVIYNVRQMRKLEAR